MHPWGPRSLGWVQASVLIITLVVALAALNSTFSTINTPPPEDNEEEITFGDLTLDEWPSDFREMFTIHQVGDQSYLRCEVLLEYEDGRWSWEEGDTETYNIGEWTAPVPFQTQYADIRPLVRFEGALPIAKDTRYLAWDSDMPMDWSPSLEVMRSEEVVDGTYNIRYLGYPVLTLEELRKASISPDTKYLSVPNEITEYVGELAEAYAADQNTPYDQAMAIRDHLRSEYRYTFNFSKATQGTDPMYWFLFGSYEGVCTHFNSAMVLMARSLGIPARLVSGYLINPDLEYQTVFSKQAHAYAEIRLDGVGWVVMDATPLAPPDVYDDSDPKKFTMTGKVFQDWQGNGMLDPVDESKGMAGVMVRIAGPNEISAVLRTDANGDFTYTGPSAGLYTITAMNEDQWVASTSVVQTVNLGVSEPERLEFGYVIRYPGWETSLYHMDLIGIQGGEVQNRSSSWVVDCALRDGNGTAVTNSNDIFVYLVPLDSTGGRVLIGSMIGRYGELLDDNTYRIECVIPVGMEAGNCSLIVRWAGDDTNGPSEDIMSVKMIGDIRIFLNVPRFVTPGSSVTATIKLTDAVTGKVLLPTKVHLDAWNGTYVDVEVLPYVGGNLTFNAPALGSYEASCRFEGDEMFNAAQVTTSFKVENPRFVMALPDLVRGENNSLFGRMLLGDIPIVDATIAIEVEGLFSGTVVSDKLGEVVVFIMVPEDAVLARYNVTLDTGDFHERDQINLISLTSLHVHQENGHLVANLTDDTGSPVPSAELTFEYDGGMVKGHTGENGVAVISIDSDTPVECRVIYEGNDTYHNSYTNATFIPVISASQWIWLPYSMAGAAAVMIALLIVRRWRVDAPSQPVSIRRKETSEGILVQGPHELSLPDIERGMPWVWHGGALRLSVLTSDTSLSLRLDGMDMPMNVQDGKSETILDLREGRHVLELEGPSGRTVAAVRVVEYGREVLDLFVSSVERWSTSTQVGPQMSPREVFSAINGKDLLGFDNALGVIEKAAYSHHPVVRADYLVVFKALWEMGGMAG